MLIPMGVLAWALTQDKELLKTIESFWSEPVKSSEAKVRPEDEAECSAYATRVDHVRTLYGEPRSERFSLEDYTRCIEARKNQPREGLGQNSSDNLTQGLEILATPQEFSK